MSKFIFSFLFAALALCASGCCNTTADPASTAKCKGSADGDKCGECCKAEGRNGHSFISGSGCTCM